MLLRSAGQAGAAAVFAFPLRIGAIRAGVMGMYRDRPGSLSDFQLGDALAFADTATMLMLDSADQAEVDQATGMVTEQLGVGIAEAFVRLRAHAYAYDRRLGDLARDIVARRVRLSPDLNDTAARWPRFGPAALRAGFAAVQALPMRLREHVVGALNLFRAGPGAFLPEDIRIGQAMADVATIGLLHERSMRRSDSLNEQLQTALNSRVVIEQAKGKLAERLGLDMDQAFKLLRDSARARNLLLSELAQAFVDGTDTLTASRVGQRQPGTAQVPGNRPGAG